MKRSQRILSLVCSKDKNLLDLPKYETTKGTTVEDRDKILNNNKILIHDVCIIQSEKIDPCVEEDVQIFEKKSFQKEAHNNISNRVFEEPLSSTSLQFDDDNQNNNKDKIKYDVSDLEEPCSSGSEYIPDTTDCESEEYEKQEDFYETEELEQSINYAKSGPSNVPSTSTGILYF